VLTIPSSHNPSLTMTVNLRTEKQDDVLQCTKSDIQPDVVPFLYVRSPYFRRIINLKGHTT
jgi:hypothetical protein